MWIKRTKLAMTQDGSGGGDRKSGGGVPVPYVRGESEVEVALYKQEQAVDQR